MSKPKKTKHPPRAHRPPHPTLLTALAMSVEPAIYRDLLADIKARIRAAQQSAALSANAEMVLLYWDIAP